MCCAVLSYTRATGWSQPGGLRLANGEYAPAAHFFGSGASYEVVGVLLCVAFVNDGVWRQYECGAEIRCRVAARERRGVFGSVAVGVSACV